MIPIPFNEDALDATEPLKVGYFTKFGGIATPDVVPSTRRAVLSAVEILKRRGHTLVPFEVPDPDEAFRLFIFAALSDQGRVLYSNLKDEPLFSRMNLTRMVLGLPSFIKWIATGILSWWYGPMVRSLFQVRPFCYPYSILL